MKATLLLALQGITAFQTPPPRRLPLALNAVDAFRQRRAWSGPASVSYTHLTLPTKRIV